MKSGSNSAKRPEASRTTFPDIDVTNNSENPVPAVSEEKAMFRYFLGPLLVAAMLVPTATFGQSLSDKQKYIGSNPRPGTTVIRNRTGRTIGRAITDRQGRTMFRDSSGRLSGTATTSNGRTIFRDQTGRNIGSVQSNQRQQTFRDSTGRLKSTTQRIR